MNETLQVLKNRRSIRSYLPKQVEEEKLVQILEAGMYAPNGLGQQSPIMVVLQKKEDIQQLSRMNAQIFGTDTDPFYGAPTVVIVLADKNRRTCVEDGSLVMGNLMNAAASLGVDSCWIHRAREEFASPEGQELLKKWGIHGDYIGIGHCLLGYAAKEAPAPKPRKADYIYRV